MKTPASSYAGGAHGAACRGFSLVEVAIALGIVAVSLLPLIGLLPIGLSHEREAITQTTRSHILTQIASDLGMLSGNAVGTYLSTPQYFDDRGERLANASGALYTVTFAAQPPSYPGSQPIEGELAQRLKRVEVEIRRLGATASYTFTFSFFDASSQI